MKLFTPSLPLLGFMATPALSARPTRVRNGLTMKGLTLWMAVLALAGAPAIAPAMQDALVLQGTVTDAILRTPIQGARVVLRGQGGSEQTAVTDDQGAYRFTGLDESASYSMDVIMDGFKPFARDEIRVSSDARQLDVQLDLAQVLESVVVKATGQVLSVVSNAPDVMQLITAPELAELPAARRNVVKYALLNPQVRATEGVNSDGNQSNRLSIKGQEYRHTGFVLDGVINYDWVYANGPYQLVAASAVEDVRVIVNRYAAEYGPSSAGTVKVNTRAGTRLLGGELFGFLTPSDIQARPPLSPFDVPNKRAQWGGLLYGPLVQDKTYYFVSYEGVDQERGAFIQSPEETFFTGENDETYALGRLDHHLNDAHSLQLRLNFYHYRNTNANDRVAGFNQPSAGRVERSQSWGGQFTDRVVIGQRAVNYLRFNFSNYSPDNNTPTGPFSPSVRIVRPSYSTEGFSQFNWNRVKLFDFSDTVALNRGRHKFKFGVEGVYLKVRDFLEEKFGEYRFPSGPPTPGEQPTRYSQSFGAADLNFTDTNVQVFAQDDFDITSRVSAHLGVRYEYQNVTGDTSRVLPRLGLAWDASGDGRTRVTAGAGLFSDAFPLIIYRRALRGSPDSPAAEYTIPFGTPGFPTFPESLSEPPTGEGDRRDLVLLSDDLRHPYSLAFSLGVERDLGNRYALAVDGTYQRWDDQWRNGELNHPTPFVRTEPGQIRNSREADASRPFTHYEGVPVRRISVIENTARSRYWALNFAVRRKYTSGVRLELRYTYSDAKYNGHINRGQPNVWYDADDGEWGPSNNHQPHRFVGNTSVDLPWDMRFAGIATVASGFPVNPLTGNDNNRDTFRFDRPVDGQGGYLGRNSFRGPGQVNVDMSLAKRFKVGEGTRVEARLDVFNVFNRNNFVHLDETYGEGPEPLDTFMRPIAGIQDTEPSRRIQFGLRILFGQR